LVGLIGAVSIILVLIVLGMILDRREEIRRRKLDVYARVIYLIAVTILVIYLFVTGVLLVQDALLMGSLVILFICCSDWTGLRKKPSLEES
jgi:hypothetical protein